MKKHISGVIVSMVLLVIFLGGSSANGLPVSMNCFKGYWGNELCFTPPTGNFSVWGDPIGQNQIGQNQGFYLCAGAHTGYEYLSYVIGTSSSGVAQYPETFSDCHFDPLVKGIFSFPVYPVGNACSNYLPNGTGIVTRSLPLDFVTFNSVYSNDFSFVDHWHWDGGNDIKRTTTIYNHSTSPMIIGSLGIIIEDTPNANGGGLISTIWHGRSEMSLFSYSDPSTVNTSGGDSARFMIEEACSPLLSSTEVIPWVSYTPTCPPSGVSETSPNQGQTAKIFRFDGITLGSKKQIELEFNYRLHY